MQLLMQLQEALIEDESIRNSETLFPSDEDLARCETFRFLGDEARFLLQRTLE